MFEQIEKSGFSIPNELSRIILQAYEEVIGVDGLHDLLSQAKLPDLTEGRFPKNLREGLDFSDLSRIQQTLDDVYGLRGSRSLAFRFGKITFHKSYDRFNIFMNLTNNDMGDSSIMVRVRHQLKSIAKFYSQISDMEITVQENPENFYFTIHRCPICWGRCGLQYPVCFPIGGYLEEAMSVLSGGQELRVEEHRCHAMGDDCCEFVLEKPKDG